MKSSVFSLSVKRTKTLLYGLLLIGIYFSTYSWLIKEDWSRADYSASFLIPIVFLYLLWEKRDIFLKMESHSSWSGMWVFVSGILLFWIGELAGEYFSLYLSSWLILVGICWIHMGWEKLREFGFALLILLAMFPLPHFLYDRLSLQLKLISSMLGVWAMQALGMSAYREGNMIDLGFTQLQVVDACSGLRYLIPLIVLGVMVAYFFKGARWKKALLVMSTVPIAVFVNSMRIASVGILYPYFGPAAAEGVFHDVSGWLIFMVSFLMLLGVAGVLQRIGRTQEKDSVTADIAPAKRDMERIKAEIEAPVARAGGTPQSEFQNPNSKIEKAGRQTWWQWFMPPQSVVAMALLGLTLVLSQGVEFRETVPVRKSFAAFPTTVGDWRGDIKILRQVIIEELDFSDYLLIDYKNDDGRAVNLYVAYYDSQRKGQSIHSPASCLPGSGWTFHNAGTALLHPAESGHSSMVARRAVLQNGGARMLSYFWFPMRGRVLHSAYEMKWFNLWDALIMKQTNGALVRLMTPIYDDERVTDAEQRLQSFSSTIEPTLSEFLP